MSRKPPKLAPVEGKEIVGSGNGRTSQSTALPSKQGGNNIGTNSAVSNTPKRSSLTRHFLNCNGSTPGTRRFPSKFSSVTTNAVAGSSSGGSSSSLVPSTENDNASNGCAGESPRNTTPIVVNSTKKVNGTISNGLATSAKTNEEPKLLKRSKSLGFPSESSVSSDIQRSNATPFNGKKREPVNSHSSVSNSTGSQNSSSGNATKRTSRFSQSSVLVSRPSKGPCPVPLSNASTTAAEKTMPALVACGEPSPPIKEETPDESDELENPPGKTDEPISEEPKIIRKGDTVIKSYVDEKTGKISVFEKGMKLEVCDFGSGKWYPAKVMNIEWNKQEILVHYSNWSSRYDEWISMTSTRVRPGKNTNVVRLQFSIGERVQAVWPMDSRRYSGTITQKLPQDTYEVTFDDGIKLKRSAQQLFKVSHKEELEDEPPPLLTRLPESNEDSHDVKPDVSPVPVTKRKSMKPQSKPRTPQTIKAPVKEPEVPPSPIPSQDLDASDSNNPNRPMHFSVFDPPPGELGKRKRTVHDYSALVKGRQRQRTPLIPLKGPRRPKSEGSSIASSPTPSVTDEVTAPISVEVTPKASTVNDSSESGGETKRRQKSGPTSNTQVPTIEQPSSDVPKDLHSIEPISLEQLPTPDHNETPAKKRKQVSSTPSTTTPVESKVPPKSDTVPLDTPPLPAPPTTTTNRRSKSLTTFLCGIFPPLGDSDTPKDTKVDSGFVDESGNAIVIEQNSEDGFWKCPLNKCGKNFRKDSLLKMHFKHYHPELKVANARGIANVVQMAQARTAFDNDPSDYHPTWPKHVCTETTPAVSVEATPTAPAEKSDAPTSDITEIHSPQKKTSKSTHQHLQAKHVSPEKTSPVTSQTMEEATPPATSAKGSEDSTQSPPKALTRSPRLRLNKRRNFVLSKYNNRIRASNQSVSSSEAHHHDATPKERISNDAIATDTCKIPKIAKTIPEAISSEIGDESPVVASPSSSLLSTSNTSSPSVSDPYSTESCSGSSSGDPVFPPTNSELEPQPATSNRSFKGRWSKAHLRRGFISSGIRRVGSGVNSATLFLKKRMQYRKFMGKRGSRQKRTSILNRISSGRMRVILNALNQRSLKRKRFRAARRYRDVKVDVINCVCSSKTEFGLMIQCELCLCWQHGSCFNVQSNSQLPDFYACQSCSEPEKVRLSRKYEWAESEFYRLGKLPSFPFAPSFSKEDARIMKMCTNLSSNLIEAYSMIKGLKVKERICFGQPDHPQLYEWNTERAPPQEEIQKDRFNKYFQPVLRRLLLENKSDPTYHSKLRKLAEARMKLRKYSDAVDSARSTLKKKLGCRAAAFVNHICDKVLNDMVRTKRKAAALDDSGDIRREYFDLRKRANAEQAYQRLRKLCDEVTKHPNGAHDDKFSPFDEGASSSQTSNGMRREATLNVKDYCVLKKYLKEKRTIDANITLTLTRMSKEFPDDWKNLMKISRVFIDESKKEAYHEAKLKWITSVIVTYNTLRILLKQIYSENNAQKQRTFCLDFERTTMKLFDLFGIGLPEERIENIKQHASTNQRKRVRGLETIDMLTQPASSSPLKSKMSISKLSNDLDEARKEILKRLGPSTKPLSSKVEDMLTTPSETKCLEEVTVLDSCSTSASTGSVKNNCEIKPQSMTVSRTQNKSTDIFLRARKIDGHIPFEFNEHVHLLDAVKFAGNIPEDECIEENLSLEFPEIKSDVESIEFSSTFTGILPVPANSRITPEVCRKNLVRDILLQQQQIDVYLDKIESQIIKLSTQSRNGDAAIASTKPAELSALRTRMLHSLELVSRLSKTGIGENDVVEREQSEDMDISETTISDYSDMDLSSESDGFDNASNFSGTDTETADEGDVTGDDDLLDV